jgi:NADPH:quinone reductase-like Zn-dependent oxidoreductase
MNNMKAAIYTRYGPPEVLQIKEIEKPVPKDNEVLVKVYSTTVTSGDARIRGLNVPFGFKLLVRIMFGFTGPRKPVPGFELAGKIEAVGTDVKEFTEGDEVFGSSENMSANAEYVAVPEEGAIAIRPSSMPFAESAAVSFGAISSLIYLRDFGNIQKREKVLINGASGALGIFAVQLGKHFGAEVTGVCSGLNAEMVKSLGANKVIDYTKEDFTQNGETYDIIFDTVGKISFSDCKASLKENGRFLMAVAGIPEYLQVLWTKISGSRKAIAGVAFNTKKDLLFIKELIETGKLKTVIDKTYPLEEIAKAHAYVEKGHKKGNVVIQLIK